MRANVGEQDSLPLRVSNPPFYRVRQKGGAGGMRVNLLTSPQSHADRSHHLFNNFTARVQNLHMVFITDP